MLESLIAFWYGLSVTTHWIICLSLKFVIFFIYMSTPEDEFDTNSRMFRFFRRLVFVFGDFHLLFENVREFIDTFPLCVGWKKKEHKIEDNTIIKEVVPKLQCGDIILHRDSGYLSNIFIGGNLIHAGIVVLGDDGKPDQIVEAISNGVVKRHVTGILRSDYAVVLRPKFNNSKDVIDSQSYIQWLAPNLAGFKYDCLFRFSDSDDIMTIEEALKADQHCSYVNGKSGKFLYPQNRLDNIKKDGIIRLCCTEIPYCLYYKYKDQLGIDLKNSKSFLTKFLHFIGIEAGETKITADMYVEANFDIIWASDSMTPEWCEKRKMSPKYILKIREYWGKDETKRLCIKEKEN